MLTRFACSHTIVSWRSINGCVSAPLFKAGFFFLAAFAGNFIHLFHSFIPFPASRLVSCFSRFALRACSLPFNRRRLRRVVAGGVGCSYGCDGPCFLSFCRLHVCSPLSLFVWFSSSLFLFVLAVFDAVSLVSYRSVGRARGRYVLGITIFILFRRVVFRLTRCSGFQCVLFHTFF